MADKALGGNAEKRIVTPQNSHINGKVGEAGANPGSPVEPKKGS